MTKPRPGGGGAPWYRATGSVSAQSIAASATWTQQIALGVAGLTMGDGKVYVPNSVAVSDRRRLAGEFYFTDDVDDALSEMGRYYTEVLRKTTCNGGPTDGGNVYYDMYEQQGHYYSVDGYLSANDYVDGGNGDIRLKSVAISGQNVELVWENVNVGNAATLTVDVEVRATRAA